MNELRGFNPVGDHAPGWPQHERRLPGHVPSELAPGENPWIEYNPPTHQAYTGPALPIFNNPGSPGVVALMRVDTDLAGKSSIYTLVRLVTRLALGFAGTWYVSVYDQGTSPSRAIIIAAVAAVLLVDAKDTSRTTWLVLIRL